MKKPSRIMFIDEPTKKAYETLKTGTREERRLYKTLMRAFRRLTENAFCGIQIPKRQIPEEYTKKYDVENLWKLNLSGAWRLLYSIQGDSVIVISIILEWLSHKEYEKRLGYRKG